MAKNVIRLTEADLHYLVNESVREYLIQEGLLDGMSNLWNGVKNVAGGVWDAAKGVGNSMGGNVLQWRC